MVRAKPPHLHAKFQRRQRLTLTDPMAKRLDAFQSKFPAISKATLARIARKDARILEITPETFASNVARTANLLNATTAAFFKLAFRQPSLIYQNPWAFRLKIRRMAKGFGKRPKDLIPILWKCPSLLSRTEASLYEAINAFAARFDIEPSLARRIFLKHPPLFTNRLQTLERNVFEAAALLGLPESTHIKSALTLPQLFYQSPQTILSNVSEAARALGLSFNSYLAITVSMPSLYTRSPLAMPRKARLIRHLMRHTKDERSFEEFLHAAKSALTYSSERILARCIIARYGLSGLQANTLLVMSNKTATALLRSHLKARFGSAAYPIYKRWKERGLLTAD